MNNAKGAARWALLGVCLSGCGAGTIPNGNGTGGPQFPSQASLKALAARPTSPEPPGERKTLAVDDWQPGESGAPTTDAEQLVKSVADAKGHPLPIEAELDCTAREIGRFFAAHAAFPDQQLQAYMAGVCGSTQPNFGVMVWATPSDTVASAERQKQWHDAIAKQLGEWLPPTSTQLGGAELSDGKTSVFAAAAGFSRITWEQRSPVVNADGQVQFSGSLSTPAGFIFGASNVGAYRVQDCQSDPRVAPPRFHITCQLDPNDSSAWVGIQALAPGRVLAHSVARVLVRREGTALGFTSTSKNGAPESVTSPDEFSKRLLALVNETRKTAQLPPLQLAKRESDTSAQLAPKYFTGQGDANLSDQIALGLLAGWDINGTIRTGNFYSDALSGSLDPKRWLGFMLEQPSARRVLLDPQARAIAIGADVRPDSLTVGTLVNTYAFYESDDHRTDVARFITRLNERRRGLGLAPAKVTSAPEVTRAVQTIKTNHNPDGALHAAMEEVVGREQHGVEGYYIEATDLDHVTLPDALMRPTVTLAVSAAHHRYPKAAWGTLTLLVVLLESSGPQRMAQTANVPHVE